MSLRTNDFAYALLENDAQFRQLIEQHSAIMLLIDPHARVIADANPAAARFYGYPLETLRGMSVEQINAEPESAMHHQRQLVLRGERDQLEVDHRLANGEIRTVKVLTSPISIQGKPHFFSIIYDITASRQAEIQLADQHRRLLEAEAEQRQLLRNLQTGIVVYAPDASIIFSKPAAARLMGVTEEQLNGRLARVRGWKVVDGHGNRMRPGDYPVNRVIATREALEGIVLGVERIDGNGPVWLLVNAFPEFSLDGKLVKVVANFSDITEQKLLQQKLQDQAQVDYLTGLCNRRHFMHQAEMELARAIRYGKNLALFMMDVDHFKSINDSHGHQMGDLVLKKLAEICTGELREVDIIGRVGGEEFAVLLPETGEAEGAAVAERIRIAIENGKVSMDKGLPIRFNVSIGVTFLVSEEDNLDVLFARADRALYEAKAAGRNRTQVSME
jgi:diguanylate cyclase (GGDEF)-like protein/PAS domain S-box-containing protein